MKIFSRIQNVELKKVLLLLYIRFVKRGGHILTWPLWLAFRVKNIRHHFPLSTPEQDLRSKEINLRKILSEISEGSFLEIGIGEFPHFERIKLLVEKKISYVGCDLSKVCTSHQSELSIKGLAHDNIRFAPNSTGTYAWTLFEMLQRGEKFDVVYIDGHHTFYIDLPTILLADKLLKPGGYLLLDDVEWTLSFLKSNLKRSLSQWYFYRKIYTFSDYTEEQQNIPHIKMIAEELLLKDGKYRKNELLSTPFWWALQKKES